MGLQCSIFGHKYGDVQSERERRENDNEVIITVRETKTCNRCGETMVVSENKEVRTVETATDAPVNSGADSQGETATPQGPSPGVGAEVIDSPQDTENEDTTDVSQETDEYTTNVSQDADDDDTAAVPGEIDGEYTTNPSPEQAAGGAATGQQESNTPPGPDGDTASREQDSEDETATYSTGGIPDAETGEEMAGSLGDGPPPRKDDAEILDDDEDERAPGEWPEDWEDETDDGGVEPPGEWPEETTGDADDWQPETDIEPDEEADTADTDEHEVDDEEPEIEPTRSALTVPEGEFYCPECGFATRVDDSSLRAGDFCPQCHEAALEHRAD
jgi:ssDNA-binding Zn-finger/Zn-ribbon topoisomerase 1